MARGDHIKVRRCGFLYAHHGIDMGDGTVVHFSGEPLRWRGARICRTPLEDFLRGGRAIAVRHRGAVSPPDVTIARALEALSAGEYCVFRNNCEHFATWCKTGRRHSGQVRRALHVAAGVVMGGVAVAAHVAGKRWQAGSS